jgi:type I restriction-modification system DNA methylase subunit
MSAHQDLLEGMRSDGESAVGNGAASNDRHLEADLWKTADALRGSMDAAEYKHVVLGLIFLKYISDAFEEYHALLETQTSQGADPEDPDEYRAEGIFWVPPEARWSHLKAQARQPTIGTLVPKGSSTPLHRSRRPAIRKEARTVRGVVEERRADPFRRGRRGASARRLSEVARHSQPTRRSQPSGSPTRTTGLHSVKTMPA